MLQCSYKHSHGCCYILQHIYPVDRYCYTNCVSIIFPPLNQAKRKTLTDSIQHFSYVTFDGTSYSTIQPSVYPTIAPQVLPTHVVSQCQLATTTPAVPLSTRLSSACACLSLVPATVTTTAAGAIVTLGTVACAPKDCSNFDVWFGPNLGPFGDAACATDADGTGVCKFLPSRAWRLYCICLKPLLTLLF